MNRERKPVTGRDSCCLPEHGTGRINTETDNRRANENHGAFNVSDARIKIVEAAYCILKSAGTRIRDTARDVISGSARARW